MAMKRLLYVLICAAVMVAIVSCHQDDSSEPNGNELLFRTDSFSGRWSGDRMPVKLSLQNSRFTVDSLPYRELAAAVSDEEIVTMDDIVCSPYEMRLIPYGKSSNAVLYQLSGNSYMLNARVNGQPHTYQVAFTFDPSGSMAIYYGTYNSVDIKLQVVSVVKDGTFPRSFISNPMTLALHATSVK
jgi:hypothetical protein